MQSAFPTMKKPKTKTPAPAAEPRVVVDAEPRACPKCGSARRSGYAHVRGFDYPGVLPSGRKYNRVVWRNCRCLDCGQVRVDRSHE